jgi:hypothetical protein
MESQGKYAHFSVTTPGYIAFAQALGNGVGDYSGYLADAYYAVNGSGVVVGGKATDAAAQWTFEEATSIDVTISSVGYATLCVPFAVTVPDGVKANKGTIGSAGDERWLSLANIEGTIPAGTPVVLKLEDGYASGTYTFNIADDVDAVEYNDLKGTYFETAVGELGGRPYVLAKPDDDIIGFYPATSGSVGANKAYLTVPDASVKAFYFFEDDATAIDEIVNGQLSNSKCYNLAGQRIMKAQKGINIVNGKKVLK